MDTARKTTTETEPQEDWVSVYEAGRQLGIAHGTVLGRVMRGELEATTFAGRTFIARGSLDRALAEAK